MPSLKTLITIFATASMAFAAAAPGQEPGYGDPADSGNQWGGGPGPRPGGAGNWGPPGGGPGLNGYGGNDPGEGGYGDDYGYGKDPYGDGDGGYSFDDGGYAKKE